MAEPWTTFSVGLPPGVDEFRKQAEDRICRVVFRRRTRRQEFKPKIWEKVVTAIALASDAQIREFFGDGE